jgi:hypothetical protein
VEYDCGLRTWRRREAIERKHAYEHAVDVRSGKVVQGVGHAPLVYLSDPRTDLPTDLRGCVIDTIGGRDGAIIDGWLHVAESAT